MQYLLGPESTAAFAELHPMLEHLDADGAARPAVPLTSGGGHQADASLEVFNYGKLWLRSYADSLNIDFIELEINILASTLVPVMLFAADVLALGDEPIAGLIAAIPVALVICAAILTSLLRLRGTERWQSLRNLAFDTMMRAAHTKLQGSAEAHPDTA